MRRFALTIAVVIALALAAAPVGARGSAFPEEIPLPDGFQPEGIAVGRGTAVFAGSLADGTIWRGDLRTGSSDVLVTPDDRVAVGMDVDRRTNYLYVAGGPLGEAYVYDASTGDTVATYELTGESSTFVNDVIVTRTAAYFTDSFRPVLYKVPLGPGGAVSVATDVEEVPLGGDFPVDAEGFNANGIVATPDGRALIVVSSAVGTLYRVDPATGDATEIDLGGATVPNGDGLVLQGRTLYVVQNFLNQIGVVELDPRLTAGALREPIDSELFRIPTTADVFGPYLYAVNARFDTTPGPEVEYEIVQVRRR